MTVDDYSQIGGDNKHRWFGVHPLRSLVTSVLSHFGPFLRTELTEDRSDQGPKWMYPHMATELLQPRDLACGTLFQSSCVTLTSPMDCSDDS